MQKNDFVGFEAVWQRVQAPSYPMPPTMSAGADSTALPEELIDRETAIALAYAALARRWRGTFCAAAFERGAKAAQKRIRQLEAAYFLAVGDSYAPKSKGRINTALPEALRELWLAHRGCAMAYDRAAQDPSANSARLWQHMAAEHRRHMGTLFGIIQHFMQ